MVTKKKQKPKRRKGPRLAELPTIPGLPPLPTAASFRAELPSIVKGPRGSVVKPVPRQIDAVPDYLIARYPLMTLPEARVYEAFTKRHLKEGVDFVYQDPQLGGRRENGGAVVDFAYLNTFPIVMIMVNGNYWHYQRGFKIINHDLLILRRLREEGFFPMVMDEDDIETLTAVQVLHLAIDLLIDISQLRGKY